MNVFVNGKCAFTNKVSVEDLDLFIEECADYFCIDIHQRPSVYRAMANKFDKASDDFAVAMQIAWDVACDIVDRLNSFTVGAQFTITEENGQEVFLLA
jgi:hypothetical protein